MLRNPASRHAAGRCYGISERAELIWVPGQGWRAAPQRPPSTATPPLPGPPPRRRQSLIRKRPPLFNHRSPPRLSPKHREA